MSDSRAPLDVVLIGGGIMSATLATMLQRLQPDWTIRIYESLGEVAQESSNPWNNAGTGHAAMCELNYMPEAKDGSVSPDKAISINEQFQLSRQFWSSLVEQGELPNTFITSTPHMTFVRGGDNVKYLRKRYKALGDQPLFSGMEYSEDHTVIREWAPLLIKGRTREPIAATRITAGTDVDFGALTNALVDGLKQRGAELYLNCRVKSIRRTKQNTWRLRVKHTVGNTPHSVEARFVFVGAGGGALHLLQSSGIDEINGFGGFPISGKFFRTTNPKIVAQHEAKVYGKAAVGAPPMSVPHLDTRVVNGEASLLFGPFAGFSPKFLKKGSWWDLPGSIRPGNLGPMLAVARDNIPLMKYLITELLASRAKKVEALREFMPTAKGEDWELITAGQRVQVMKKDAQHGGVLQFGTEVVAASDGSIAGLLGASPGASTAVPIMLDVLQKCFPKQWPTWEPKLAELIPTMGTTLNDRPKEAARVQAETSKALGLEG
ncbi:MAG TPA: malate:quinone oxidoreductase [Humibacter sp.]|nr:malate:quinone oxidoreductase [Humibacter sp.]